ncbi:unknown [Clostridium sp. CAG:306]|nr:unknown [Clostridium sp. CAG:306]
MAFVIFVIFKSESLLERYTEEAFSLFVISIFPPISTFKDCEAVPKSAYVITFKSPPAFKAVKVSSFCVTDFLAVKSIEPDASIVSLITRFPAAIFMLPPLLVIFPVETSPRFDVIFKEPEILLVISVSALWLNSLEAVSSIPLFAVILSLIFMIPVSTATESALI